MHTRGNKYTGWKRSARCGPDGGNCVEVNLTYSDGVGVRDSADSVPKPVLAFGREEWQDFIGGTRAGRYDH